MTRDPRSKSSPRVGIHVDDEFLGDQPVSRPEGLDPFVHADTSAEGEAALELLPKLARTTGSYDTVARPRQLPRWAIAVVVAAVVVAVGIFILAHRL
ncbi:MAG: hypothetical protein H7Z43_12730 [Clostridia bacterium]|nr:hypothetical protein [Deltaproteobacteria bacterium]